MCNMLQASTTEPGGTSTILHTGFKFPYEIGAKTGTTSNYSDAWFMGITPDLVCGMWVGGEDRSIHFRTGTYGQGAREALPLYGLFMQKVYKDKSIGINTGPFPLPATPSKWKSTARSTLGPCATPSPPTRRCRCPTPATSTTRTFKTKRPNVCPKHTDVSLQTLGCLVSLIVMNSANHGNGFGKSQQ